MLKKVFAFFVAASVFIPSFFAPTITHANNATKLEIIAPSTAVVGEAFDITVRALDSNNQVAKDYRGSIIFSTDWLSDTLPMPGRPIVFTEEDQGEKKFSKGVIFKKAGKNKLYAIDVSGSLDGEVTILTEEGNSSSNKNSEEVKIISPTKDSKIIDSKVTVSGTTRKNSKVSISLNGNNVASVITDDSGTFSKEITGINQENNVIKASLLDAEDAVIGESEEINFTKTTENSSIYGLIISPSETVDPSQEIKLTVEAIKGLSEVNIELDNSIIKAQESADGKYIANTTAPNKPGDYNINVEVKTITGQSSKKDSIATLKVVEKKSEESTPSFKNIKTETEKSKVKFSFEVENKPQDLSTFKITYGATGSVITYTIDKIFKDGKYNWYIDNLDQGDYTFKIQGQRANSSLIDNLISEPITATIGSKSCTISNVGKISVKTDTSKSILSWNKVEGAIAYNVYKVTNGKYSLVKKVEEPSYTVYLSRGNVEYGDFAIKALCDENTESSDYSDVSKVQTGPGAIAFIVIASGIFAAIIMRRRAS